MSPQHELAVGVALAVGSTASSVLIFVPGMADIVELTEKFDFVNSRHRGLDGSPNGLTYCTVPIHSDIPFEDQLTVFEPAKPGEVKVVIATNAAESSVTIPDCDHVVCLGTAKQIEYNAATHRTQLVAAWISRSSARQRAGRTGRTRPGHVYRLYSRSLYDGTCVPEPPQHRYGREAQREQAALLAAQVERDGVAHKERNSERCLHHHPRHVTVASCCSPRRSTWRGTS